MNKPAITTKNISCPALGFSIPKGTKFIISHVGKDYAACNGLGITTIWNDEYILIENL